MKRQRFALLNKTELERVFLNGTYLTGRIECSLNDLRKTLGKKFTRNMSDKTTVDYIVMLEDKTVFTVYDYKYYGKDSPYYNPDKVISWSIGAKNEVDGAIAKLFMYQLLEGGLE